MIRASLDVALDCTPGGVRPPASPGDGLLTNANKHRRLELIALRKMIGSHQRSHPQNVAAVRRLRTPADRHSHLHALPQLAAYPGQYCAGPPSWPG